MLNIRGRSVSWLFAEVAVVAIGILLALAIDAWWKDFGDRRSEQILLRALHEEFGANQKLIEDNIDVSRRRMSAASALLSFRSDSGEADREILNSHWQWVMRGAIYSPSSAVLESAVSSGQISVLRDSELRVLLANWPGRLAVLTNVNTYLTDLIFDHMIPWMRTRTALPNGGFGNTGIPSTTSKVDFALLSSDTVVENLLREEVAWGRVVTMVESGLEKDIALNHSRIMQSIIDN